MQYNVVLSVIREYFVLKYFRLCENFRHEIFAFYAKRVVTSLACLVRVYGWGLGTRLGSDMIISYVNHEETDQCLLRMPRFCARESSRFDDPFHWL